MSDAQTFLTEWHAAVTGRDGAALSALLADDIVMNPPPYWSSLETKPIVGTLLGVLVETFEEFTYHREWIDDKNLALEFTAEVNGMGLQGVDLLTLNDANLVQRLDVMIRPLNTLQMLQGIIAEKMQAKLAELNS